MRPLKTYRWVVRQGGWLFYSEEFNSSDHPADIVDQATWIRDNIPDAKLQVEVIEPKWVDA